MECSFEETINYPDGSYKSSKCINEAKIFLINDPCYGLCYRCAYRKLQAENKQLKKALKDCISYVDIDNLTMQTKARNWIAVLDGKPWNPANIDIET